jgi:hypothetical protein
MAIKGLKEIQEKSAEAPSYSNQNRINYLYLGDGEFSNIRFIRDDEIIQTKIHEYEELTPNGKKYRKAYCAKNLNDIPCKWCAAGNIPKNVYVALVYVGSIIHKNQNPELNNNPSAPTWETLKQGTKVMYREDVNDIRVLRVKFGKDSYIKTMLLEFAEEYGTLCDREYKFTRKGEGLKTMYSFTPKDPSEESEEFKKAKTNSISIEEILIGPKKDNQEVVEESIEDTDDGSIVNTDLEDLF